MDWGMVGVILAGMTLIGTALGFMINRLDRKFGAIDVKLNSIEQDIKNIDRRLTIVETILSMWGAPIQTAKKTGTHQ